MSSLNSLEIMGLVFVIIILVSLISVYIGKR